MAARDLGYIWPYDNVNLEIYDRGDIDENKHSASRVTKWFDEA